jgi:hypothetical protein
MPPRTSSTRPSPDHKLAACGGRHPKAWAQFRPVLEETLGASITDTPLPMVELRLN